MDQNILNVTISAETKENANEILKALIEKKLVPGGPIINSPAKFSWKGKLVDMNYFTIMTFTVEKNKKAIIEAVEELSGEEIPMITFTSTAPNEKLLNWVVEITK